MAIHIATDIQNTLDVASYNIAMYVHVNVHIHMCVHVRTQVFVCVCP